jgi:hypothetical protein
MPYRSRRPRYRRRLVGPSQVARLVDQPAETAVKLATLLNPIVKGHLQRQKLNLTGLKRRGKMKPRAPSRFNTQNYRVSKNKLKMSVRRAKKGGLYVGKKYAKAKSLYSPMGLNSGHRHKFKSDIKGAIFPMSHHKGYVTLPLKKYQRLELRFFPYPVTQKLLIFGNQSPIQSSDNLLSDKIDFERFCEVSNKDLLSISYFPISNCANFSGVHSWIRHDIDPSSESFNKVSVLGRQNRCPTDYKAEFNGTYVMQNKDDYFTEQETILRHVRLKAQIQSTKNFPCKLTISLVRLKQPGQFVSNAGMTFNELVEVSNVQNHIDYDAGAYIFSQSKIIPPVSKNKVIQTQFDVGASMYYKLTKKFRDETAVTLLNDQTADGVTFKYGQQMKSKIAAVSGVDVSNRLFLIFKCKRLGDTQLATIKRGYTENSSQTTANVLLENSIEQNVNAVDSDINSGYFANGIDNIVAGENMNVAGFRIKSELNITYLTKEATREIPTWTSGTNAGKTRILNASVHDSNYGTLNTGYNVT